MATSNCNNCGCKKCGCQDDFLTTPPACPTPLGCPDPEPCSEVINAECIVYTGLDIECGLDTVVLTDTNISDALNDITTYFCDQILDINTEIDIINVDILNLQNNQGLFNTAFRGTLSPTINVNTVTQNLINSNIANGVVVLFPLINVDYQIVNGVTTTQYDPITGIWTCPQTGKYDINYNVYLTAPSQVGFGWGDTLTPGTYTIGVTNPGSGTSVYCADTFTITPGVFYSRLYLTGGIQGKLLTAGTQLVLRHQNMTGINYTGILGDNIDWAVRRVG
jgi:hypothetical protein